jgi:hypothetical protein
MANISTYPIGTPAAGDLIPGTQQATDASGKTLNLTRNFSVADVAAFANSYSLGYTVYTALLTQVGEAAPTAKILQSTIPGSNLAWARTSAGIYTATAGSAIFTVDKTIVFANNGNDDGAQGDPDIIWSRTSDTVLTITASAGLNNVLTDGAFEVRIYA